MKRPILFPGFPWALAQLLWAALAGASGLPEINPAEGAVDGKAALFYAAFEGPNSEAPKSEEPESETYSLVAEPSLKVHLVAEGEHDDALRLPANQWILPPPNRYRYWLEGDGWMSPASNVMRFVEKPFAEAGKVVWRPVVPAGEVCLAEDAAETGGLRLRLIHTESHNRGEGPLLELARQQPLDQTRCARMPAGPVLSGLYDPETGEYLAIGRPVKVTAGARSRVSLKPPNRSASDLLVILDRPRPAARFEDYDVEVEIRLEGSGDGRQPDLVIPTSQRIFAVWYGLSGKYGTLRTSSPTVFLEPQEIILRPGRVERFAAPLRPLPDLSVRWQMPEGLAGENPTRVEVVKLPLRESVRSLEIPAGEREVLIEDLPPSRLEVQLRPVPWLLTQRVDLRSGEDGDVLFQPEPIEVQGTVFRGEDEHPATLTFITDPENAEARLVVETDEAGRYEAIFLRDGYYPVGITLRDRPNGQAFRYAEQPVSDTPLLDFHLPANEIVVEVVDSAGGRAIENAEVIAANRVEGERRSTSVTQHKTDPEGRAFLSPQQTGFTQITARAEGYQPAEPLRIEIAGDEERREVRIELEPVGSSTVLTLLLPSGQPAAGAETIALRSAANGKPLWRGTADAEGRVALPDTVTSGAIVAAKHATAAFIVRPWEDQAADGGEIIWRFEPAAPKLAVKVESAAGDGAPWSPIKLEIDGIVLEGILLRWLTGRAPATDGEGMWRPDHLPARPLRVAAWKRGAAVPPAGLGGANAIEIPYPRDGLAVLQIVE